MTGQLILVEPPTPALKKNPPSGAPRLLRRLVAGGLHPDAVEHAAALVAQLDADARDTRRAAG